MENRGTLSSFMMGKLAVALAAMFLIGIALSFSSGMRSRAQREELELIASSVTDALKDASLVTGEVELVRRLPTLPQGFELTISGKWSKGVETVVAKAGSGAESSVAIGCRVNEGYFSLTSSNPTSVRVTKICETINLTGPAGLLNVFLLQFPWWKNELEENRRIVLELV